MMPDYQRRSFLKKASITSIGLVGASQLMLSKSINTTNLDSMDLFCSQEGIELLDNANSFLLNEVCYIIPATKKSFFFVEKGAILCLEDQYVFLNNKQLVAYQNFLENFSALLKEKKSNHGINSIDAGTPSKFLKRHPKSIQFLTKTNKIVEIRETKKTYSIVIG